MNSTMRILYDFSFLSQLASGNLRYNLFAATNNIFLLCVIILHFVYKYFNFKLTAADWNNVNAKIFDFSMTHLNNKKVLP